MISNPYLLLLASPGLDTILPYAGGTNPARDSAEKQSFDVYEISDDLASVGIRSLTDDNEAFYNISNVLGVDITEDKFWVSEEATDELKEAAQHAYDLINSGIIYTAKDKLEDLDDTRNPNDLDVQFYTTDLVKVEVDKLNNALKKYDNSVSLSIKGLFSTYINNMRTKFFTSSGSPENPNIFDYFTLPVYDTSGKIDTPRGVTYANSNTFLSTDGIYAITKEILSASEATPATVSKIENKQLITGLVSTATANTHFYVLPEDFDTVYDEVEPLFEIVTLGEQVADTNLYTNADSVAKLKAAAQDFIDFKLSALEKEADSAIEVFESTKKPIVTYAETRDPLKTALTGADYTKIKKANGITYIDDPNLVISDDGGFSCKTYNATSGEWTESMMTSGKKWVSSQDLRDFSTAIDKAKTFLTNTLPTIYEIEPNATGTADDEVKDEPLDGEPVAATPYAKVDFDQSILDQIQNGLATNKDIFVDALNTLEEAQSAFDEVQQGPNPNLSAADGAYTAFKSAVGDSYILATGGTVPVSQATLGYVKASDFTAPTNTSGIKAKVYAQLDADGKVTAYFPVDTYVTSDTLGVINPLTKKLYGQDASGGDDSANAPTKFVAKNMAEQLIEEIQAIDKFLEVPLTEHFQAYALDNTYFDNALESLKDAAEDFDKANLAHLAGDFVTAYKAVQAKIVTGAADSAGTLTDYVSKFPVANAASPTEMVALKLKTGTTLDDSGAIKEKDDIEVDDNTSATKVFLSEDGISKTGGALAVNDYWVTPVMFTRLKDAIWSIQNLVNDAKDLKRSIVEGYAANPDNYFDDQVAQSDLEDAKAGFIVTEVLQLIAAGNSVDWIKEAELILYGKVTAADGTVTADGPGGEGEQADANISQLLDGFDVLTFGMLQAADEDQDGLDEAELEANFRDDNKIEYITKEYADELRNALAAVEAEATDETVKDLATLVNAKADKVKVASVSNNLKIDLYNSYIALIAKLLDENGQEIYPSDNRGANVLTSKYWVTSAQYRTLTGAIENTEKLLNTTETLKAGEAMFTNQVKAQIATNGRINFKLTPGVASAEVIEDIKTDKTVLLETINLAATLAGVSPYKEDGTIDINGILSDERIVVSTKYGLDVFGEDLDGNFVPDSGDRWTTAGAITGITRSIATAVANYNSAAANSISLQKANDTLKIAIRNFENNAKYGTASTYQKVLNNINTLINNIENGNEGYDAPGLDGAPIVKIGDITISTLSGADKLASQLWTTTVEQNRIKAVKDAVKKTVDERANLEENLVRMDLPALVLEYNRLKTTYENFYGRDISGKVIDTIIAKALPGTNLMETFDLKTQLELAVAKINALVYLPGVNRLGLKYTKFDGTPLNEYGHDRYDIANQEYVDDEKGYGDGGSYEDIHVSSKTGGIDVPTGVKWISTLTLNRYAQSINMAQQALDKFEAAETKAQNQAVLNNAVRALEAATILFDKNVQNEKISISDETVAYNEAYSILSAAIKRAESLVDQEGLLSGDSATLIVPSEIISIRTSLSGDGQEVNSSYHWVPIGNLNGYRGAITTAKGVLNAAGSLTIAYERGLANLQKATDGICKAALTRPGLADDRESAREELEGKITEAETVLYGDSAKGEVPEKYPLAESINGLDISENRNWTTPANYKRIKDAITAAKTMLTNLESENGGTGRTTVAQLRVAQNNIATAITAAAPKIGDLSEETESEQASLIRSQLRVLINEAADLIKYRQSAREGRDIPDGVNWVTNAEISGFESEEGKSNGTATAIKFLDTAQKVANAIYVKKYTDMDLATADYRTAVNKLEYCIEQFENVASNLKPNGEENDGNKAIGGQGSLTSITTAKKVLADKINKANADVVATVENSDPKKVADGRWYATSANMNLIKKAITEARIALNSLEATEDSLTKGSLDGLTSVDDQVVAPTSALGKLNAAYELFAGVDDGNANSNVGINGTGATDPQQHRTLKGHLDAAEPQNVTPVGLAATAVEKLFTEANSIPTIPLAFVLDANGAADTAGNSGALVKAADIKAYIENLIVKAIDNDEITVTVTLDTTAGYGAPSATAEGSISDFTVLLEDAGHPVATKWTIQKTAAGSPADLEFETAETTLKVNLPMLADKWNDITAGDIVSATGLIISNNESFELSGSLFDYDLDITGTNAEANKAAIAQTLAKAMQKQIEDLINNPNITVTLYDEGATVANIGNSTPRVDLTDSTLAAPDAAKALVKAPVRPTAEDEGEDGEFKFKVKLSIPFADITGISSRAVVNENFEEITDEDGDGTGTANNTDLETYTVLLEEAITATIKPEPYKVAATTADIIAVNLAKKQVPATTTFTIDNTIANPGNTVALANVQILEQVQELLDKLDESDKKLIKDVKISVMEDFENVTPSGGGTTKINKGFTAPTENDSAGSGGTAGSYQFNIAFTQNNATAIAKAETGSSPNNVPTAFDVATIAATPYDELKGTKRELEKFEELCGSDIIFNDKTALNIGEALELLDEAISKAQTDANATGIIAEVIESEFKAPIKATFNKAGVAGWLKFAVKLSDAGREMETFVINVPIKATAYEAPTSNMMMTGIDVPEYILDYNYVEEIQEIQEYEESLEEEYYYSDTFEEEFIAFDEPEWEVAEEIELEFEEELESEEEFVEFEEEFIGFEEEIEF